VTLGALAEAGIGEGVGRGGGGDAGAVVAFETEGVDGGAAEEAGVGGAVGEVAGGAAIDAEGGVFEGEGAAFVGVALEAGHFAGGGGLDEAGAGAHGPGGGGGAVGIVAVRTGHEPFVDAVFGGERELGADVRVACVAEVTLLGAEEGLVRGAFVNGVAVGADDLGLGVGGAPDGGAAERFGMTGEAGVEDLFLRDLGEGANFGFVTFGGDVVRGGAVAGFAGLFEAGVGIAEEGDGEGGVAGFARGRAGVLGHGEKRQEAEEEEEQTHGNSLGKRSRPGPLRR